MNRYIPTNRVLKKSAMALMCAGSLIAVSLPALAYTGEAMAKDAKISLPEAQAIALKAQPGTIVDTELEKESGGSGLRYSFDVKNRTTTYEVGVDAETGKLLESVPEGKNPD
ncbi:MAG: PepSY domain-containing protein [Parvibaculum sp.]|nr:PepSY domain-containing protein [Parvibaculum sp.]